MFTGDFSFRFFQRTFLSPNPYFDLGEEREGGSLRVDDIVSGRPFPLLAPLFSNGENGGGVFLRMVFLEN